MTPASFHFSNTPCPPPAMMDARRTAMTLNPSINLCFNGQCEAAFKFYEQHLGGKMVFKLTWGDSPMASDAPPGWSEKLMHARLIVGETALLGSDVAPASYEAPRGFAM